MASLAGLRHPFNLQSYVLAVDLQCFSIFACGSAETREGHPPE
jgi:hypothetical protein